MKKIILVANVAKDHILKFHVPTIKQLSDDGWIVDVACGGTEVVPYCHRQYELPIDRSPFKTHFIKAIKQLRGLYEQEKYDVVYCHTEVGGIVARLAATRARKMGTKVVKLDHGFYFYKGASALNWAIHYPIDKYLANKTDAFILINKEDYNLATQRFKNSRTYLINGIGVNLDRLSHPASNVRKQYRESLGIPESACALIYCAEISENKNQKYLLQGLKRLLLPENDYYLVLVGRDLSQGALTSFAENLGIQDHVRVLGWREDIGNLYAMSDICTASSIREGFGINIVEAQSCGIPVIATNNRGHSTIIKNGENGILVDLNKPIEIADAVQLLRKDSALRNRLIDNALSEISKYSCDVIAAELSRIISEISNC